MLRMRTKGAVSKGISGHQQRLSLSSNDLPYSDRYAYQAHPLAATKLISIDMEYDEDSDAYVTYVKELHGMSTFGNSELEALDNTREMIRGFIKSMEANKKRIPLSVRKLAELKHLVGMR